MKKVIVMLLVLALCTVAKADFTFGTPTNLGSTVNSSSRDLKSSVSADGMSLFFTSTRSGGVGGMDIWVTTRETTDDPWGKPVNLGSTVNSSWWESGSISYDGLSFYFSSTRSRGSNANADLWVTTRDTIHNEWGTPINLGPTVNSSVDQCYVSISADELSLYFSSNRSGGYGAYDLWVTTRETTDEDWGTPVNLGPTVNTSAFEVDPAISADGRILFFTIGMNNCGSRCGYGGTEIWMTRRPTTNETWGEPVNLGPTVNSSAFEDYPNVSADGSTLYFRYSQSGRYSGGDLWQAPIIPIIDFNGDGIVDAADMCIMVDYWGTDESLCDVGPMPWGDGIVDVQDLIVLAEHLFEEPGLIAYWKLDETEGMFAADSVGDNDAFVFGGAAWQPDSGQIGGALQLDGVDGCAITGPALNPADGPFSIFAWIKGGAPGQVIISQADGTGSGETWLGLDALSGNLMTGLVPLPVGRFITQPMESQCVVTDGQWHRIGFVWDGSYRILYADDIKVAIDNAAQNPLKSATGGLYIGTDKGMEPGTYWSGLIDDVRIYNRVVMP